jgi:hypothetical protein
MTASQIILLRRVLPVLWALSLLAALASGLLYIFYRDTLASLGLILLALPVSVALERAFYWSVYGGLLSCPRCRRPLSGYSTSTFRYVPFTNPPCPHCGLKFRDNEAPLG